MNYKEENKIGLMSLIDEIEEFKEDQNVHIRMFSADLNDAETSGIASVRIANSE